MTSAEQQAKITEYQGRVDVLKALLAEAETRLTFFRNATPDIDVVRRRRVVYPPAPFSTATQPQETCTVTEFLDAATRTDEELTLDHRSGSGENSAKCRELFEQWLGNHGLPGEWHKTSAMCGELNAWQRFTKHVVDAVLEQMVTDGLVEAERNPWTNWPGRLRIKHEVVHA